VKSSQQDRSNHEDDFIADLAEPLSERFRKSRRNAGSSRSVWRSCRPRFRDMSRSCRDRAKLAKEVLRLPYAAKQSIATTSWTWYSLKFLSSVRHSFLQRGQTAHGCPTRRLGAGFVLPSSTTGVEKSRLGENAMLRTVNRCVSCCASHFQMIRQYHAITGFLPDLRQTPSGVRHR
jgi:hypothetical protein